MLPANCYFFISRYDSCKDDTTGISRSEVPIDIDSTAFKTVFYIGKGLGSMVAGGFAYM